MTAPDSEDCRVCSARAEEEQHQHGKERKLQGEAGEELERWGRGAGDGEQAGGGWAGKLCAGAALERRRSRTPNLEGEEGGCPQKKDDHDDVAATEGCEAEQQHRATTGQE